MASSLVALTDLVSLCAGLVLVEKESRLVRLVRKSFLIVPQLLLNSTQMKLLSTS